MKVLLFPDIVADLTAENEHATAVVLHAAEVDLELLCHRSFLSVERNKVAQIESFLQANGTLLETSLTDADRAKVLEYNVPPEKVDLVAIALQAHVDAVWTDEPISELVLPFTVSSTDDLWGKFTLEQRKIFIEGTVVQASSLGTVGSATNPMTATEIGTIPNSTPNPNSSSSEEELEPLPLHPEGHPLATLYAPDEIDIEVRDLFRKEMRDEGIVRVWVDEKGKDFAELYSEIPLQKARYIRWIEIERPDEEGVLQMYVNDLGRYREEDPKLGDALDLWDCPNDLNYPYAYCSHFAEVFIHDAMAMDYELYYPGYAVNIYLDPFQKPGVPSVGLKQYLSFAKSEGSSTEPSSSEDSAYMGGQVVPTSAIFTENIMHALNAKLQHTHITEKELETTFGLKRPHMKPGVIFMQIRYCTPIKPKDLPKSCETVPENICHEDLTGKQYVDYIFYVKPEYNKYFNLLLRKLREYSSK